MATQNIWYDIGQTLSYNCLFNFVIGARGSGKTYAAKKRAVKQFLEKGYQFVYLRRFADELKETAESYFNDILFNKEFADIEIKYKDGKYYINDELAGYAMALTKAKDYKSISYPLVYLIIFDEFLIEDNGFSRYLKNEVTQFLNLYMSIDRYRGCTVFFLANAVTMVNPYTLYFDINLPYGSNITRKGDVLLQLVQNEAFVNARKETRFGKLIEGTPFADYAIDNKFMNDNKDFIEQKTGKSEYLMTLNFKGDSIGIWIDYRESKMFVSPDIDKTCTRNYSLTTSDHSVNTIFLTSKFKPYQFTLFLDYFRQGIVFFENQKVKNIAYNILRMYVGGAT